MLLIWLMSALTGFRQMPFSPFQSIAPVVYWLLGPVSAYIGYVRGSGRHRLQVAIAQRTPNAMQTDAVPSVAAVGPN